MDPLTGLGAAAAVAQFAELAFKVVELTGKLYTAFKNPEEIRSKVEELRSLGDFANVMKDAPDLQEKPITDELNRLNCTAKSLVDLLEPLQVSPSGSGVYIRRLWKAWKVTRHEKDILARFEALERSKSMLTLGTATMNS